MLRPLGDHIVIELAKADEKTPGGIVLPEKSRDKEKEIAQGRVVAVGPGRLNSEGKRLPLYVKEGERVLFTGWGGTDVDVGKGKFRILTEGDILAVLD